MIGILNKNNVNIAKVFGAFTLAEVLITLTIIGVIAAITIPNLMKKWEDHHTVAAVKEAYSIIDNALKITIREEGIKDLKEFKWPNDSQQANSQFLYTKIKDHLKIAKVYGTHNNTPSNLQSIFSASTLYNNTSRFYCGGQASDSGYAFSLQNGMNVCIDIRSSAGYKKSDTVNAPDIMGYIWVDINGLKKPNRMAYDIFGFNVTPDGLVIPRNYNRQNYTSDVSGYAANKGYCNKDDSGWGNSGRSCAIWVLLHGNVDYKYRNIQKEW